MHDQTEYKPVSLLPAEPQEQKGTYDDQPRDNFNHKDQLQDWKTTSRKDVPIQKNRGGRKDEPVKYEPAKIIMERKQPQKGEEMKANQSSNLAKQNPHADYHRNEVHANHLNEPFKQPQFPQQKHYDSQQAFPVIPSDKKPELANGDRPAPHTSSQRTDYRPPQISQKGGAFHAQTSSAAERRHFEKQDRKESKEVFTYVPKKQSGNFQEIKGDQPEFEFRSKNNSIPIETYRPKKDVSGYQVDKTKKNNEFDRPIKANPTQEAQDRDFFDPSNLSEVQQKHRGDDNNKQHLGSSEMGAPSRYPKHQTRNYLDSRHQNFEYQPKSKKAPENSNKKFDGPSQGGFRPQKKEFVSEEYVMKESEKKEKKEAQEKKDRQKKKVDLGSNIFQVLQQK